MPDDRIDIDVPLVRQLVVDQFPHWSHLPVTPADPMGWDNFTCRLVDDMKVRLPSAAKCAMQAEKEYQWLPKLAPRLPLPIPAPRVIGKPADGYPWMWSISRWIEGETATLEGIDDLSQFRGRSRSVPHCPATDRCQRRATCRTTQLLSRRPVGSL